MTNQQTNSEIATLDALANSSARHALAYHERGNMRRALLSFEDFFEYVERIAVELERKSP